MTTNLPYLYICTPAPSCEFLHLIDLSKPRIKNIVEIIDDVQYFDAIGIQSNYKNPFKANFIRNAENSADRLSSGSIKSYDRPIRFSNKELLEFLEPRKGRGKDNRPRKIHQNSLNNLKKNPDWTCESRPTKPKKISDELVDEAIQLKSQGMSWRKIGDKLQLNFQSVRTAINRRNSQAGIGIQL